MLKKITMLAMAVAAVAAFAVPAAASAATDWTDNGTIVKEGVDLTETYEGALTLSVGGAGTFTCQVTTKLTVTGPTKGELTQFTPTVSSCAGTGAFTGCKAVESSSNTSWTVANGTSTLGVTKSGGNTTVHILLIAPCFTLTIHIECTEITATPTLVEGRIASLAIASTSTSGVVLSGSLAAEGSKTLGLK